MKSITVTVEFKGEDSPYSKYTAVVGTTEPEVLIGAVIAVIAHHRMNQEESANAGDDKIPA